MGFTNSFQSGQLVCVDCRNTTVYAEVIQVVEERQVCWARPLLMVDYAVSQDDSLNLDDVALTACDRASGFLAPIHTLDVRESVDLLLPLHLFRAAFDTELLPFLGEISSPHKRSEGDRLAHQKLREFVTHLC